MCKFLFFKKVYQSSVKKKRKMIFDIEIEEDNKRIKYLLMNNFLNKESFFTYIYHQVRNILVMILVHFRIDLE